MSAALLGRDPSQLTEDELLALLAQGRPLPAATDAVKEAAGDVTAPRVAEATTAPPPPSSQRLAAAVATAPSPQRAWPVAYEPDIPPGTPTLQRSSPSYPLDPVDSQSWLGRGLLQIGSGQTEGDTQRQERLARMAGEGFAGSAAPGRAAVRPLVTPEMAALDQRMVASANAQRPPPSVRPQDAERLRADLADPPIFREAGSSSPAADRKSTRLNSSHQSVSRMPSSA